MGTNKRDLFTDTRKCNYIVSHTHLPVLRRGVLVKGRDGGDERARRVLQHSPVPGLKERCVIVHVDDVHHHLMLQAGVPVVLRRQGGERRYMVR